MKEYTVSSSKERISGERTLYEPFWVSRLEDKLDQLISLSMLSPPESIKPIERRLTNKERRSPRSIEYRATLWLSYAVGSARFDRRKQ
jgi:hypothetical protein